MDYFIIFFAKYLVYLSVAVSGIFFLKSDLSTKKKLFLYGILLAGVILLSDIIAGKLYYNPRPFVAEKIIPLVQHSADNGFPSDHTILAAALAVIILPFSRKFGTVLFGMAMLVAFGRVSSGVHHLIDVLASFSIAIFWGTTLYFALRKRLKITSLQA